jgi:hypothetical protein
MGGFASKKSSNTHWYDSGYSADKFGTEKLIHQYEMSSGYVAFVPYRDYERISVRGICLYKIVEGKLYKTDNNHLATDADFALFHGISTEVSQFNRRINTTGWARFVDVNHFSSYAELGPLWSAHHIMTRMRLTTKLRTQIASTMYAESRAVAVKKYGENWYWAHVSKVPFDAKYEYILALSDAELKTLSAQLDEDDNRIRNEASAKFASLITPRHLRTTLKKLNFRLANLFIFRRCNQTRYLR